MRLQTSLWSSALLVALLAILGRAAREEARSSSRVASLQRQCVGAPGSLVSDVAPAESGPRTALLREQDSMFPLPAKTPGLNSTSLQIQNTLAEEMKLSETQLDWIRKVLENRETDISVRQSEILESGVFRPFEYGDWLARRREHWFRQIDLVLNWEQHEEFKERVARGLFNPGTQFCADLEVMVVLP